MKITSVLLAGLLLCGCSKKPMSNDYPKETWAFAGYASPDSALESWAWAFSQGERKVMLQCLVPEAQTILERELAGKSDGAIKALAAQIAAKDKGYTIQSREIISGDDVILHISEYGSDRLTRIELKKIGSDWKLTGPCQDDSPPNPR